MAFPSLDCGTVTDGPVLLEATWHLAPQACLWTTLAELGHHSHPTVFPWACCFYLSQPQHSHLDHKLNEITVLAQTLAQNQFSPIFSPPSFYIATENSVLYLCPPVSRAQRTDLEAPRSLLPTLLGLCSSSLIKQSLCQAERAAERYSKLHAATQERWQDKEEGG